MDGWRAMMWIGGMPPMLFGLGAYYFIPEYAGHGSTVRTQVPRPSVAHHFSPALRSRTFALSAMMGGNAYGSQAFSGWLTTYLYEVARLSGPTVGAIVACQFVGSVVGCIGWGWAIDRYGRRAGAFGLVTSGIAVTVFLLAPPAPLLLGAIAAVFGIAFSAVVSIGPRLAELYLAKLRTAATSMFQWGRFISLLAPLATGRIAAHWGLGAAMGLSVIAFGLAAAIWSRLPETLGRDQVPNRAKLSDAGSKCGAVPAIGSAIRRPVEGAPINYGQSSFDSSLKSTVSIGTPNDPPVLPAVDLNRFFGPPSLLILIARLPQRFGKCEPQRCADQVDDRGAGHSPSQPEDRTSDREEQRGTHRDRMSCMKQ